MSRSVIAAVTSVAVVLTAPPASADFDDLITRLPRGGNVLVLIDAEEVLASGLAEREGWKKSYESDFVSSPMLMPPGSLQFALTGRLDFATFSSDWEAAVVRMDEDTPMSAVARHERGVTDTIAGVNAVASPKGFYIAKLGDSTYGVMRPGDRQQTARWLRDSSSADGPRLSDYLTVAAAYPDNAGTEMILSIDLADAISRTAIREGVSQSPVVKKAGLDVDAVTDELASLRGLTLGVKVSGGAVGAIRVDFANDPVTIKPIAKDLLLEVLAESGAAVDEFYDWKVGPEKLGFRLSGRLDRSGLMRIFSFLELDTPGITSGADADAAEETEAAISDPNRVDRYVSQQYFERVINYLDDLKGERGAKSYYSIARWFEKYADRIDRLPLLGVDPELTEFSRQVVDALRDCASTIRGSGIRTTGRIASGAGTWGYAAFPGRFPHAADVGRAEAGRRLAIKVQERANSSMNVRDIVNELQAETSRIRRAMTQKHGVEF